MESLSNLLSPFDELEFVCEEHGIPCIGLCSNYLCKERTKLLCMKCIKSGETCITKEGHELITLAEMLYRFFIKEENKSFDLMEIQTMSQIIKDYNKSELNKISTQFRSVKDSNEIKFDNIRNIFTEMINYLIDSFEGKNKEKLENLKSISNNNKNEDDIKLLLNIKIPEVDKSSLDNNQKLIDFMNNGYKLSSPKNFINSVKFLNHSNKFIEVSNKLNKKLYANNITDINEEKKAALEKKIDSIFEELEQKFDEKLEQIENDIILPKDDISIYTSRKVISKFVYDPNDLVYKEDICSSAHKTNSIDKVFCAFNTLSGESLVVWGTPQYSIEFYDLEKGKIIKTILNAHNKTIFTCRHCVDLRNNVDYIITSSYDKIVKVWDIKSFQSILNIKNPHSGYYIYSVTILCDQKEGANYIITSAPNEYMKVFDFIGTFMRSFGQNDESTYFIDTYYDSKEGEYYIINANSSDVKSYVFKTGKLYHKYKGLPQTWHMSAIVSEIKDQQILIESDGNGYIRMWEFHTGNLIKNIPSSVSLNLRGICLWNDDYLFAAGNDYQVKLFDLAQGKFIKSFKGHTSTVCSIEKIVHPTYGECLISQGLDGKLKLWISNNKKN